MYVCVQLLDLTLFAVGVPLHFCSCLLYYDFKTSENFDE